MQRNSITADIFGYIVCLLAVVIFFMSAAGVVNNAFHVVHPAAHHRMVAGHMRGGFGHRAWMGRRDWQSQGAMQPATGTTPQGLNRDAMRARMIANARFEAVRGLVLALVMLGLSIVVFRRTFEWLNPRPAVT
jgi:hypothetical protein